MDPVQTIIDIFALSTCPGTYDTTADVDTNKRALEDWYFRGGFKPKLSDIMAKVEHSEDWMDERDCRDIQRLALHLGAIDDLPKPAEIVAEEDSSEEDSYSTAEIMEGLMESDNTEERMLGDIISAAVSNCEEGEEDCAARNALVKVRNACIDALKEMSKRGYDTSEEV